MTVLKCKMCGGDLNVLDEQTVCECEYCGTRQTVPKADDEKKLKLFARAGRLLRACEFDKAAGVYEAIVADFDQEAEAYWGLILCKYGIEYVDDPATGKKIPTCHRSSFDGVLDDANFELVMENADAIARPVYRAEAKEIERIRKGILEVSAQEEPYDVFICYKETDEQGDRTVDSLIAQDVYTALTEKGYRVFFSRISLEDKLGQEYEPYIFAALHSARVMLAFGTSYENYDAVWVKNEWSRFLSLMARGEKKTLIPCYKDLDAYDMPKEFQRLQAQDMGKVGAIQDLVRGVEKIIGKKAEPTQSSQQIVQQIVQGGGPNVAALLERGNMALEDQDWKKAKDYFDQVLSMDAKNAQAYLGLAMVEAYAVDRDLLADLYTAADSYLRREENKNIARARKFDKELNTWFAKLDQKGRQKDQKQQLATNKEAKQLESIRGRYAKAAQMIAAGWSHTVGLKADGTVIVTKRNNPFLEVCNWRDIAAISAGLHYGSEHIVGLKNDGTVVAVGGKMNWGQCDVGEWRNIVAISAGYTHTVGLKADGTVVAAGLNSNGECDINEWHDIVAVSAGDMHTVGLKKDGTVITAGADYRDCCKVDSWRDIVAVAAGHDFTLGLTSKGTVLRTDRKSYSLWNDIVAIAAGDSLAVGLKKDGTVVTQQFSDREGKCDVSSWHDIVAIAAGSYHIAGLKADGTVIAQMCQYKTDSNCRCVVGDWKLFNDIDTLEDERKAAAERAKAEAKRAEAERRAAAEKAEAERRARIADLNKEKDNLQTELSNLRGLFTGRRRREIEARIEEIDTVLEKLG